MAGSVIAHEIGHNPGLDHIAEAQNLMQADSSITPGQRLNTTQINTARGSTFAIDVPEPTAFATLLLLLPALAARRRSA